MMASLFGTKETKETTTPLTEGECRIKVDPMYPSPSGYFTMYEKGAYSDYQLLANAGQFGSTKSASAIDIYKNYHHFKKRNGNSGFTEESLVLTDLVKDVKYDENEYAVRNKTEFKKRFNKMSGDLLTFMDWDNVVVGGGSVYLAASNLPMSYVETLDYDIDIFVYGVDETHAKKLFNGIYESFKDVPSGTKCVRTNRTLTVVLPHPYRHIQFVFRLFKDKHDVLHSFDIQSSKMIYDGDTVYTTIDGHFGLMHHVNILNTACDSLNYTRRLVKYAKRGVRVLAGGLDKKSIASTVYHEIKYDLNDNIEAKNRSVELDQDDETSLASPFINTNAKTDNVHIDVIKKLLHYDKFGIIETEESISGLYQGSLPESTHADMFDDSESDSEDDSDVDKPYKSYGFVTTTKGTTTTTTTTTGYKKCKFTTPVKSVKKTKKPKNVPMYATGSKMVPFFIRGDLASVMENLQVAQERLLINLKHMVDRQPTKTEKHMGWTFHDISRFPVYKVFNNLKSALIHRNNYDANLNTFYMNGPTFDETIPYRVACLDGVTYKEFYTDNSDEVDSYTLRSAVPKYDYTSLYKSDVADSDIEKILSRSMTSSDWDNVYEASINRPDRFGMTYMMACLQTNNVEGVKKLLSMDYNILERYENGDSPLHYAIKYGAPLSTIKLIVEYMKEKKVTQLKVYDNNMCTPIHIAIMFGSLELFKYLYDQFQLGYSDVSWNVRSTKLNLGTRRQKYFCCTKVCLMYDRADVLEFLLSKYVNFNSFRYLFVDSDIDNIDTLDVIQYVASSNACKFLPNLLKFFTSKRITLTMTAGDVNTITSLASYGCSFAIESLFLLSKVKSDLIHESIESTISIGIVKVLVAMFKKREYGTMLKYIYTYVPDVWTNQKYKKIHDSVKFVNLFGNKYVDTDHAIKMFHYVQDSMWDDLQSHVRRMQYGMYVYESVQNTTVLSLCYNTVTKKDDPEKLARVLDIMNECVLSKTQRVKKKIHNLIFVNRKFMNNLEMIRVALANEKHRDSVRGHIKHHFHDTLHNIYMKCLSIFRNGSKMVTDFTEFTETLKLLSKYECDVKLDKMTKHLPVSLKNLQKYKSIIDDNTDTISKKYCDFFSVDKLDPVKLYKTVKTSDQFLTLVRFFPDFTKNTNLLNPMYGLYKYDIYNSLTSRDEKILLSYSVLNRYFEIGENDEFVKNTNILKMCTSTTMPYDLSKMFISYLRKHNMFDTYLKQLDFKTFDVYNLDISRKEEYKDFTDVNGSTYSHVFYRDLGREPRNDVPISRIRDADGKTPLDYIKAAVNNVSKYSPSEIPVMFKNYKKFMSIYSKQYPVE